MNKAVKDAKSEAPKGCTCRNCRAHTRTLRAKMAVQNLLGQRKFLVAVHDPHRVDLFEFPSKEKQERFAEKARAAGCEIIYTVDEDKRRLP